MKQQKIMLRILRLTIVRKIMLRILCLTIIGLIGLAWLWWNMEMATQELDPSQMVQLDPSQTDQLSGPSRCVGDLNRDGSVDQKDVDFVKAHMGTHYGDVNYNSIADLDRNLVIDQKDLDIVVKDLGCKVDNSSTNHY